MPEVGSKVYSIPDLLGSGVEVTKVDQRTKILGILAWVLIALALSSFWWCCSATTAEAVPETETWAGNAIIAAAAVQGKSAFWMISIIAENMEDTADRVKIPDSLSWGFLMPA